MHRENYCRRGFVVTVDGWRGEIIRFDVADDCASQCPVSLPRPIFGDAMNLRDVLVRGSRQHALRTPFQAVDIAAILGIYKLVLLAQDLHDERRIAEPWQFADPPDAKVTDERRSDE